MQIGAGLGDIDVKLEQKYTAKYLLLGMH